MRGVYNPVTSETAYIRARIAPININKYFKFPSSSSKNIYIYSYLSSRTVPCIYIYTYLHTQRPSYTGNTSIYIYRRIRTHIRPIEYHKHRFESQWRARDLLCAPFFSLSLLRPYNTREFLLFFSSSFCPCILRYTFATRPINPLT